MGQVGSPVAWRSRPGPRCVGVDINQRAIEAASNRAQKQGPTSQVSFQLADAANQLPFPEQSFDAIFCNDSINHLPRRLEVLRDWNRLLRPGGRLLYTDPIVVTGQLTNEEIKDRSSIGFFVFSPVGCNEDLLRESGFLLVEVRDLTEAVASVAKRWRDARAKTRTELVQLEGEATFDGLQHFLHTVHVLAKERRLSRYMYLASKPV